MRNKKFFGVAVVLVIVAVIAGLYRLFFVWPVGDLGARIDEPEALMRNVPATIRVHTAQSYGQSRRCDAQVKVLSDFIELREVRSLKEDGKMTWELDVVPVSGVSGTQLALAFTARGGGVETVRQDMRFWPRGRFEVSSLAGSDQLAIGTPGQVTMTLNQDAEETKRLGLQLRIENKDWMEASDLEEVGGTDSPRLRFALLPHRPVWRRQGHVVAYHGDIEVVRAPFAVTADAPAYYHADGQAFSEMIGAPDVDIYGSHITVWDRPGSNDRLLVTGHAASDVCRVASAALMGYASHVPTDAPTFFIGAGLGSFDLRGTKDKLRTETAAFLEAFPGIGKELEKLAGEKAGGMIRFADMLAKLADMPALSEEKKTSLRADALQERIKELSDALLAYADPPEGLPLEDMPALSENVGKLVAAVEPEQTLFGTMRRDDLSLDAAQVGYFQTLLMQPEHAVAALAWNDAKELHDTVVAVMAMPQAKKDALQGQLAVLVELIEANERINRDLKDLETRTGLLKFVTGTASTLDTAAETALHEAIREWTRTAEDGEAVSLTALASGHRGASLLPYCGAAVDEVVFTIPRELFESGDGAFVRDLFLKSSVFEFAQLAKEAAERTRETAAELFDSLRRTAARASGENLGTWLAAKEKVRIQNINDTGEVIGTEEVERTRAEGIAAQWRTAVSMQQSARMYARLAESAERLNDDKAFLAIIEGCLLDSMLRGWKMSFSDDKMAAQYKAWMEQARPRVWESLWQQAEASGMDPRHLVTESTVWAVRPAPDGTLRITPRFIADLGRTWVEKHGELAVYGSTWHRRQPRLAGTADWQAAGVDADALAAARESTTPAASLRALGADIGRTTIDRLRSDLQHLGNQATEEDAKAFLIALRTDAVHAHGRLGTAGTAAAMGEALQNASEPLGLGFAAAPESVAATLTDAVLGLWPVVTPQPLNENEARAFASLEKLPLEDDLNKRWAALGDALEDGSWPLADHYALFAVVWQSEADDSKQTMERIGAKRKALEQEKTTLEDELKSIQDASGNTAATMTQRQRIHNRIQVIDKQWNDPDDQRALLQASLRLPVLSALVEKLLANGRAIDKALVDDIFSARAIKGRSTLWRTLEAKIRPWAVEDCLQAVVLLSEAQRTLTDWDDGWAVAERVRRGLQGMRDELDTAGLDVVNAVSDLKARVLVLAERVGEPDKTTAHGSGAQEREDITKGFAHIKTQIETRAKAASNAERPLWQKRIARLDALEALAQRGLVSRPERLPNAEWKRQRLLAVLCAAEGVLRDSPSLRLAGDEWILGVSEGIKSVHDEIEAKTSQSFPGIDALDQRRFRARLSSSTGRLAEQAANSIRSWHQDEPSRRSLEALVQLYWHSGNYAKALVELTDQTRRRIAGLKTTLVQDVPAQALLALYDRHRAELIKACVYSGGDFFGTSLFGKHASDWCVLPKDVDHVVLKLEQDAPIVLPAVRGSDVVQLYEDAVADKPVVGRKIGVLEVLSVHKSYTALRAFKVRGPDGISFLKVMPNDPAGLNRAQMTYGTEVADHLRRAGVDVVAPVTVSSEANPLVYQDARIVVTREKVAPGQALDDVAKANGGRLTDAQIRAYVQANLAAAVKGTDLKAANPDKPPVRTTGDMHAKLAERSRLGRRHLEIFGRCPSQQAGQQAGTEFHDALEGYIQTTWATGDDSTPIRAVGLVHDAIFRNAFLSKNEKGEPLVTLIDFADDYIGPVGHAISIMLTQLMTGDWTYEAFRGQALSLIEEYGRQSGRTLDDAAAEIVGNMAYHPYKFMSSDGKQLMVRARAECGIDENASDDDLAAAMSKPDARAKVDALLQDKELADKYRNQVRVMQACLQLSLEYEKNPGRQAALKALIEAINEVLRSGIRVASLDEPGLIGKMVAVIANDTEGHHAA